MTTARESSISRSKPGNNAFILPNYRLVIAATVEDAVDDEDSDFQIINDEAEDLSPVELLDLIVNRPSYAVTR